MNPRRGYALFFVLTFGAVLAVLSTVLLYTASRDGTEGRQQAASVQALYAAEAGVSVGVNLVINEMKSTSVPDVKLLRKAALKELAIGFPGASFDDPGCNDDSLCERYSIAYILDKDTGATSTSPPNPPPTATPLAGGPFRGLVASQLPIQVLASAEVGKSTATVGDAVQINLIPVFQFAVFMDGPIEFYHPEASTISGRIHTNSGFYFGDGADSVSFIKPTITAAGRIELRELDGKTSATSGRAPKIDTNNDGVTDVTLPCDNSAAGAVGCPSGATWLAHTKAKLPMVRDMAHEVGKLSLPTGVSAADFAAKVTGVPDICGIRESDGAFVAGAGQGVPLSPDWQLIDLPRASDTGPLKQVKYAHRAGIRVIDGVWSRRSSTGDYDPWFSQADPTSAEAQCVYFGYNPSTGKIVANSDEVPAIQDLRFWDFQDRRMRRTVAIDVHRLTACLPFLESTGFNGVLFFGESLDATKDNWGLNPDASFYELVDGACQPGFVALPHYLRGQMSTANGMTAPKPGFLKNDDVTLSTPRLDNPYYPVDAFCAPKSGRAIGLGDGPFRLPQGNGNGKLEPGKNELIESGVVIRNAQRLPNVVGPSGLNRGFTLATNAPVYLQGDINTRTGSFKFKPDGSYAFGKVPASVVSDAVTFLSDKYNFLLGNPYAPVGPMAGIRSFTSGTTEKATDVTNVQLAEGSTKRAWAALTSAKDATPSGTAKDFDFTYLDTVPDGTRPVSPAPCSNLLRELVMRRRIHANDDPADNTVNANLQGACAVGSAITDCGYGDLTSTTAKDGLFASKSAAASLGFSYGATVTDWSTDLRSTVGSRKRLCADTDQNGCSATETLVGDGKLNFEDYLRASNAFVAYAPLEAFLDLDKFRTTFDPSSSSFSSRSIPSARNDREAMRDWMRCTLNGNHHLFDVDDLAALKYGGNMTPGVLLPTGQGAKLQQGVSSTSSGMRASGKGVAYDLTYKAITGSNGWGPIDTTAAFLSSSDVLFARDRSGLTDSNGTDSPNAIDDNLGNLSKASAGDQLALNLSILTGTTWRCPNEATYPAYGANNPANDASSAAVGKNGNWSFTGLDEGLYGIFRYQESWFELGENYIDFFVNGSVVVMFYSREANGKHLLNQGFFPNMLSGGCASQDNSQTASRQCRTNPGFEYAWESSRRSIKYDPDNDAPTGMPPGVPLVISSDRLRWVRR